MDFLEGRVLGDQREDRDFRGTGAALEFFLLPRVGAGSEGGEHVSGTGSAARLSSDELSSSPGAAIESGIEDKSDVEA